MKNIDYVYVYIKTIVLQVEASVLPRFRVILTGIQGHILVGQNTVFEKSKTNLLNTEHCPNAVFLLGQRRRHLPNIKKTLVLYTPMYSYCSRDLTCFRCEAEQSLLLYGPGDTCNIYNKPHVIAI